LAQDLSPDEKDLLVSIQGQTNGAIFETPLHSAAWQSKPSWYVISSNDKTIQPEQQRDTAKRLKAQTLTVASSHVPMLSNPEKVAEFMIEAAKSLSQ
jgi:pimeloyl-ACP methyl ester carboxylesterase